MKYFRAVRLLLAVLLLGARVEGTPKPPFVLPINLEVAGAIVVADFRVSESLLYEVQLQYDYKEDDQQDRARAWRF